MQTRPLTQCRVLAASPHSMLPLRLAWGELHISQLDKRPGEFKIHTHVPPFLFLCSVYLCSKSRLCTSCFLQRRIKKPALRSRYRPPADHPPGSACFSIPSWCILGHSRVVRCFMRLRSGSGKTKPTPQLRGVLHYDMRRVPKKIGRPFSSRIFQTWDLGTLSRY